MCAMYVCMYVHIIIVMYVCMVYTSMYGTSMTLYIIVVPKFLVVYEAVKSRVDPSTTDL